MSNKFANKKQKLLSRKEELLNELKYYEARIKDAKASKKSSIVYDDDSSDSEMEFTINTEISLTEMKAQKSQLQTCLRATEELTGVTILQSEVNILVDAPTFEGEAPITEDGTWRAVMAECRVDLVCFTISFYTHQPSRAFAPAAFRGLQLAPVKLVHERELARSVLPTLCAPSDAVEVLRSYAAAHRERRCSLARLAARYEDALFMEPAPDGGYVLRCAALLRASWSLQNKASPLAPFVHKMAFDLEYMDESYVKQITQAHKQLCDPSIGTDDRTLLLAEIIDTCLEARRQMGPPIDSDAESQNSKRQTSDQEMDVPVTASELMGPPKSLPKKTKPKGKENVAVTKRGNDMIGETRKVAVKKTKTDAINTKDKSDKKCANLKNCVIKISNLENANSKHNNTEDTEKTKMEEIKNIDKGNTKTKILQKSKDRDIFKNADVIKTKDDLQTHKDDKSANIDGSTKNNNLKGPTKAPKKGKSKESKQTHVASKVISSEKEPNNFKPNINQDNVNKVTSTQNEKSLTVIKNLKTKACVDENEPKSKKSKTSAETNKLKPSLNQDNIEKVETVTKNQQNEKSKTVTKNLKMTKAFVDENELKSKKSKTSIAGTNKLKPNLHQGNVEKVPATHNEKSKADLNNQKSKTLVTESINQVSKISVKVSKKNVKNNNVNKTDTETDNNPKVDKRTQILDNNLQSHQPKKTNEGKNKNKNAVPEKDTQITDINSKNIVKQSEISKNHHDLKTNGNNENNESSKKSSKTNSTKQKAVQKPPNIQTLSERFSSKNTQYIEEKSNNPNLLKERNKVLNINTEGTHKNPLTNDNIHENNTKSSKNNETNHKVIKNQESDNNALKSKLNSKNKLLNVNDINIRLNKNDIPELNIVKSDKKLFKSNLNYKPKLVHPKTRKSLGLMKKVVIKHNTKAESVGDRMKSKIPQKRSLSKQETKLPLRISPRKHQLPPSAPDSSTRSLHKQTNIPRLVKKPSGK